MSKTLQEVLLHDKENRITEHIFGSDYYLKKAKSPSGGKQRSSEINGVSWPPPPERSPSPEVLETAAGGVHQAVQAIVAPVDEDDVPRKVEDSFTSDSDLSCVNFYDVEHSQVVIKSRNEDIQIPIRAAPMGMGSYKAIPDENGIDELKDDEEEIKAAAVPVAKPRVLGGQGKSAFAKAPPATKRRVLPARSENAILRRHLSESDLLRDPFDAVPNVSHHQKKDNTIISKIYRDPKVRLFALNSREGGVDGGDRPRPTHQTQTGVNSNVQRSDNSASLHGSEDALTSECESGRTGKMSFFSSEEDLRSFNSEAATSHRSHSPGPQATPKPTSTRKFIYGSSEDLLAIDEVESLPQRRDNTLISKIYKDPNVRNFAKAHGHVVPDRETSPRKPRKISSSDEDNSLRESKLSSFLIRPLPRTQIYNSYDDLSSSEISLEHNDDAASRRRKNEERREDGCKSEDLDVEEIAKKHLVRDTLGKLSRSEANVATAFARSTSVEESNGIRLSVRDLRKKFESNDGKSSQVISSLTARSLSKQMKDSLKQ